MKKAFYFLYVLLLIIACATQKPEKQENIFINNAIREAKAANKLLVLDFWSPASVPSVSLNRDIFDNEKNAGFLSKNFIVLKLSPADSVYYPLLKRFGIEYQSAVIVMDKNGNEVDRTAGYNGKMDDYLNFLKEVSEGKNLYSVVFSTYKKDSLNVLNNFLLAEKLTQRFRMKDAIRQYNNVLLYDRFNKSGLRQECRFKIAECEQMMNDLSALP